MSDNDSRSALSVLPPMPPSLAAREVGLRPERTEDAPFIRELYRAIRWPEMAAMGWPEAMRIPFLDQQFDFQTRHYRAHYAGAAWCIVTLADQPIGRLYFLQGSEELRVIDISILPQVQGQGIGSALMRGLQKQAQDAGTLFSLHVAMDNPRAHQLYERLGFVPSGESGGTHQRMEWDPSAQAQG